MENSTWHPSWCAPDCCATAAAHPSWIPSKEQCDSGLDFFRLLVHTSQPYFFTGLNGHLTAVMVQAQGYDVQIILEGANPESDVVLTPSSMFGLASWVLDLGDRAREAARASDGTPCPT